MIKKLMSLALSAMLFAGGFVFESHAANHRHYTCGHTDCSQHSYSQHKKYTYSELLPESLYVYDDKYYLGIQSNWEGLYLHLYLEEDLTLDKPLVITGIVDLCLNGKTLKTTAENSPVIIVNGTLVLCDCDGNGVITGGTDGGVHVSADALTSYFYMLGGIIKDNSGTNGGGVVVTTTGSETANFKLYDGTISENTATTGGGVYVGPTTGGGGCEFYYIGGTIADNTAITGGDIFFAGSEFWLGDKNASKGTATTLLTVDDLYLSEGKTAVMGPLLSGSKIGVSLSETRVFTNGWNEKMGTKADPTEYFFGSNGGTISKKNNELLLTVHEHVWETDYSKDASGHWIKCTSCSATKDVSTHTLTLKTAGTTSTCTEAGTTDVYACICGYATGGETVEAAGHSWETDHDSSKHWSDCKNCDAVENEADHELYVTAAGKAADCDEDGYTDALACDCGYTVASESISKKGHSWSDIITKAPLTHWYDCTVCDARNQESAHNWTATDKVEADCTTPGREAGRYCSDCGHTEPGKDIPAGHDMVPVAEKAPTCTAPGHEAGARCSRCGHTTGLTELPQTDHPWEEELDRSDTQHWRVCGSCGHADTKTDHALTEVPGKTPTCTEDGYTSGVRCETCGYQSSGTSLPAPGHQPANQWSTSETSHWHICTECSQPVGKAEHSLSYTPKKNATCTEDGTAAKAECSICCYTEGGEPIPSSGHSIAAALTHDGTHHWYPCANCDAKDGYAAHSWTVTPQTDATCTQDGITEKKECACGAYLGGSVIPAAGHALNAVSAVDPGCTTEGREAGQQCENCSYFTGMATIPAAGHNWQETLGRDETGHWKICSLCCAPDAVAPHDDQTVDAVPATCTVDGREAGRLCRDCGYAVIGAVIPAPGHSWHETLSFDENNHWYACANCTGTKDLFPHQPEYLPAQSAGCETDGITEGSRCACGYATVRTNIPAAGHSWQDTVEENCLTLTCGRCQSSGGSLILTLPADLVYDGYDKPVSIADTLVPEHSLGALRYYILYEQYEELQSPSRFAGTYKAAITVTIGETEREIVLNYEIEKGILNLVLTMEGWTYGEPAKSPVLTGLPANAAVRYTYQPERPVNAGTYTVTAEVPESEHFAAATVTQTFTVARAVQNAPDYPYDPIITSSSITFDPADALEYSLDGETWVTERVFSGLSKATEYTFQARLPGDDNRLPSPAIFMTYRTLDTFTVRYDANGGTGALPPDLTLEEGTLYEPQGQGDLRRSGYNFAGWEMIRSGSDILYKAKWDRIYVAPSTPVPSTPTPSAPPAPSVPPVIPEVPAPMPFLDIKDDDWFSDDVRAVLETGLMIGTAEDHFSPELIVDRATAATVLYRLAKGTSGAVNPFRDVDDGTWYSDAIAWCAANGIVQGDGNGTFRPFDAVTRQEMALMLQRAAKHLGQSTENGGDLSRFPDGIDTAPWAEDAVAWCVDTGLILGSDIGLMPAGETPRCQLAALLNRFLKYLE